MIEEISNILEILRNEGSIIVNKNLARAIGIDAAIMYSELVSKNKYFLDRGQLTEDGFFFNTVENMQNDTMLSCSQQKVAINKLIKLNLIQKKLQGKPQKQYFRINSNTSNLKKIMHKGRNYRVLNKSMTGSQNNKEINIEKAEGNTNSITPENNTGIQGISASGNPLTLSFEDFKEETTLEEKAAKVLKYFMETYTNTMGKEHMRLKLDTWIKVADSLFDTIKDDFYGNSFEIYEENLYKMIDHYFTKRYQAGCNYCITHFNDPQIKKVNYFEAAGN